MKNRKSLGRRGYLSVLSVAGFGSLFPHITSDSTIRQHIMSVLDPYVEEVDLYTAYELHPDEFIGEVAIPHEEITLRPFGYSPHHLAAAKYHPYSGQLDGSSWRKIDTENPRWQWHIHLWDTSSEGTEISSHYEYRPDVRLLADESVHDMANRLEEHYSPKWDTNYPPEEATYFVGKTCDAIEKAISSSVKRASMFEK